MQKIAKIYFRRRAMEIARNYYLDKLIRKRGNGLIKVITQVWEIVSAEHAVF